MEAVRAYWMDPSDLASLAGAVLPRIHERYRVKFEKLRLPQGKEGALAAGLLLAEFAGAGPESDLRVSGQGKPFLSRGPFFSLSHSDAAVLLAVSESMPLGADLERPGRADARILRRVSALDPDGMSDRERTEEWTRVEASLKLQGTGFYADPKAVDRTKVFFVSGEAGEHLFTVAAEKSFELELFETEFVPEDRELRIKQKSIIRKDPET